MSKTKLDWALEMQAKGLAVFPVTWTDEKGNCSCGNVDCKHKGKHPLPGSAGFKDATLKADLIKKWWAKFPEANIGVYPGDNFVVVDLDVKGGKVDGIANFIRFLGLNDFDFTEQTLTVKSPSGGYHLYYKTDTPYGDKLGLLPGVDIRAAGGYVVGPGSIIGDKTYSVENELDINPLHEKISEVMGLVRARQENSSIPLFEWDTPGSIARARGFLRNRKPAVAGDTGNNHTYATIAGLKDLCISDELAIELLMEEGGWNDRCDPPWSYDELSGIITNVYKYGKDRPGSKGGSAIDDFDIDDGAQDINEVLKNSLDPYAKWRLNDMSSSMMTNSEENYEFIAYGFVPAQGYTAVLSDRGVGKSTVLIDFCMRLTCDMDWHGVELDKGWSVRYIVGEDIEGVIMRHKAWCHKHGVQPDDDRWRAMRIPINMADPEEVRNYAMYVQEMHKGKKILFVLDTWQRMTALSDGGQNDDVAMQKALHNVEGLARSFKGPCLIAFHPPKNNKGTIMGSSTLENASHSILNLTLRDGGKRHIETIRIKGCESNNYKLLDFEKVEYGGTNKLGVPLSGPVPKEIGNAEEVMDHIIQNEVMTEIMDGMFADVEYFGRSFQSGVPLNELARSIEGLAKPKDSKGETWSKKLQSMPRWTFTDISDEKSASNLVKLTRSQSYLILTRILEETSQEKPYRPPNSNAYFYMEKRGNGRKVFMGKLRADEIKEEWEE